MYKSIHNPKISNNHPDMSVYDLVLYFHNGQSWILIPLSNMLKYIVITTTFTDFISKDKSKITIARCPVSGIITILKGSFKINKVDKEGLVIVNRKHNIRLTDNINIKRWSCYVDTLKNVLTTKPDGKFIILDKVNEDNYGRICYQIEYNNGKDIKKKAIIGRKPSNTGYCDNINPIEPTTVPRNCRKNIDDKNDMRKNGIEDFFNKYSKEIDIKMAVINPVYCSYLDKLNIKKVRL